MRYLLVMSIAIIGCQLKTSTSLDNDGDDSYKFNMLSVDAGNKLIGRPGPFDSLVQTHTIRTPDKEIIKDTILHATEHEDQPLTFTNSTNKKLVSSPLQVKKISFTFSEASGTTYHCQLAGGELYYPTFDFSLEDCQEQSDMERLDIFFRDGKDGDCEEYVADADRADEEYTTARTIFQIASHPYQKKFSGYHFKIRDENNSCVQDSNKEILVIVSSDALQYIAKHNYRCRKLTKLEGNNWLTFSSAGGKNPFDITCKHKSLMFTSKDKGETMQVFTEPEADDSSVAKGSRMTFTADGNIDRNSDVPIKFKSSQ